MVRKPTKRTYLVNAVVCFAIGVAFGCYGWVTGRWARASTDWPHVVGTIVETNYSDGIAYEYEVEGRQYSASRYKFSSSGVDNASFRRRRYPLGKQVRVYYDPAKPGRAVLVPGSDFISSYGITMFGAAFCVVAGICVYQWSQAKANQQD